MKPRIPMQTGDGVLEYSIRTRVQLDYHFLSTRSRNPRYSIGTCTRRSMYSVLQSKKAPSTQVHLDFARSNKQNELSIENCIQ